MCVLDGNNALMRATVSRVPSRIATFPRPVTSNGSPYATT
jgi:hypothetical protein